MIKVVMLKSVDPYFTDMAIGRKWFDVRLEDTRKYAVGDTLFHFHYDAVEEKYLNRHLTTVVNHVYRDPQIFGPFVVLLFDEIDVYEGDELIKTLKLKTETEYPNGKVLVN